MKYILLIGDGPTNEETLQCPVKGPIPKYLKHNNLGIPKANPTKPRTHLVKTQGK
jgi:hypothetical protein